MIGGDFNYLLSADESIGPVSPDLRSIADFSALCVRVISVNYGKQPLILHGQECGVEDVFGECLIGISLALLCLSGCLLVQSKV